MNKNIDDYLYMTQKQKAAYYLKNNSKVIQDWESKYAICIEKIIKLKEIIEEWEPLSKIAEPDVWLKMYSDFQELLMLRDKEKFGTTRPYQDADCCKKSKIA